MPCSCCRRLLLLLLLPLPVLLPLLLPTCVTVAAMQQCVTAEEMTLINIDDLYDQASSTLTLSKAVVLCPPDTSVSRTKQQVRVAVMDFSTDSTLCWAPLQV